MKFANLAVGDPAPFFTQRTSANPRYNIDVVAGRYLVLFFFGSAADERTRGMLSEARQAKGVFDAVHAAFFGITIDPDDEAQARVTDALPGVRFFLDYDLTASKLYGAIPTDAGPEHDQQSLRRICYVLDPTLRVRRIFEPGTNDQDMGEIIAYVQNLPAINQHTGIDMQAPIIVLPNVFDPELCRHLISLYEQDGGTESGFMRQVNGKTVAVTDHNHKRRRDYNIADNQLVKHLQGLFLRRVVPEIEKVHQFKATRMERYIVACYAAEDKAHFNAHRDNTTSGTAHRRFAVSVNLNDDFDGGEVSFPEYGTRSFKAPVGGAVVFSCSLLHAVSMVTRGRRYAFLPFLYDDAAAAIRERNNANLDPSVGQYKAAEVPAE